MIDIRLLAEADRHLTVCNACRYCEGICPVFTSLERRRTFLESDIVYLANLCHDCRACLDVCPFSPPHELNINIPKVLSEVREQTYQQYAAPRFLSRAFSRGTRTATIVTLLSIVVILAAVVAVRSDRLIQSFTGPGAFYEVIPWLAMFVPAMLVSIYGIAVLLVGAYRFWRDTDGPFVAKFSPKSFAGATADVLLLRRMRGGGPGCTYPEERPTHRRAVAHQLVFYGFVLTFVSTVLAFVAQEVVGILPPYPLWSPIVLSGTVGGAMQVVGAGWLIAMKLRASTVPASAVMRKLDFAFLALLILVNGSGLALLLFRDTAALGLLLVVHLGTVAGLFITMPYGKFVHLIYRYAALVRNQQEERQEQLGAGTAATEASPGA
jgi:citrate/tricarballylate utilization protein